jgi:uncharacterized protein
VSFVIERDERSAPFYDATARGVLLIRRCPVCGSAHPPDVERCRDSDSLVWEEASGVGTLVSWAVDHAPPLDPTLASADGATSTFGYVELAEGPWLQVPILVADQASLSEGMAMEIHFIRPGGGEAIPVFVPAE